ncbi:MAG: MlaD family protein [Ignavibacteria bacterium]|jgi:phospholipid/cholesterol/gamma-HCH transport system substrate-binding protein|nr:MlaD family protein [Ignavibacteria bacterium]
MNNKLIKKLVVAFFIATGLLLFLVAIFIIGSKQNMFTSTMKIYSAFETVSGLREGSTVRFNGISVGTVDGIDIISGSKVMVEMTVVSSVRQFIKRDSKAKVVSEGLIGNKIIDITPGSENVPSINEGEWLESIKPVDAEDILKSLKETGENASIMSQDLADILSKVNNGEGTLGQLINNNSLYNGVDSTLRGVAVSTGLVNNVLRNITSSVNVITTEIIPMTQKIRDITEDISEITRKINSSESVVGTLLTDTTFANNLKSVIRNADQTTANLEQGSFSFSQNMEALKHNFFFKGYFEDLGYWDKTSYEKNVTDLNMKLKIKQQELEAREKRINELEKTVKELQEKTPN